MSENGFKHVPTHGGMILTCALEESVQMYEKSLN